MREKLGDDSPRWRQASDLLRDEPGLRKRMEKIYEGTSASGLYQDERTEGTDFGVLVAHVCKTLARSPRTVLRQALDEGFRLVRQCDHFVELLGLLELAEDANVHTVEAAVRKVGRGSCFHQLKHLEQKLSIPSMKDAELRGKIEGSCRNDNKSAAVQIERAMASAKKNEAERRQKMRQRIIALESQLETDAAYGRHRKVHSLWEACGGHRLWRNYQSADLAVSQKRGEQGREFERLSSDLCFAMITTIHQSQHEGAVSSMYSFERNVHWWRGGNPVGEIDLIVYHRSEAIAICEMKNSAFEVSRAPQQHEAKLRHAAESAEWGVGATPEDATCLTGNDDVALYVATILPNGDQGQVGADPALVYAICQGIRSQGVGIAHQSTIPICRPVARLLLDPGSSAADVVSRLSVMPPMSLDEYSEQGHLNIDIDRLKRYVIDAMNSEDLLESPHGCFLRMSSRMLVLPGHGWRTNAEI